MMDLPAVTVPTTAAPPQRQTTETFFDDLCRTSRTTCQLRPRSSWRPRRSHLYLLPTFLRFPTVTVKTTSSMTTRRRRTTRTRETTTRRPDTQPPWARDDTVPRHPADAAPTVTEPTVPDPPVQDPPVPSPFPSASYVNREQERLARRRARSDRLRAWEGPEPCDPPPLLLYPATRTCQVRARARHASPSRSFTKAQV